MYNDLGVGAGSRVNTQVNSKAAAASTLGHTSSGTAGSNSSPKVNWNTSKNEQPQTITKTVYVDSGSSGGGGGYSSGGGGSNIIDTIKSLLAEQQEAAKKAAEARWKQADELAKQNYEGNRDALNVYKEKGERWVRNKYSPYSGLGISASIANNQNWLKNLASNRQNYSNNQSTNLATYNTELSNAANTLAQGYYNYVLPYYTNEAVNDRNLEFRKYLAGLNL